MAAHDQNRPFRGGGVFVCSPRSFLLPSPCAGCLSDFARWCTSSDPCGACETTFPLRFFRHSPLPANASTSRTRCSSGPKADRTFFRHSGIPCTAFTPSFSPPLRVPRRFFVRDCNFCLTAGFFPFTSFQLHMFLPFLPTPARHFFSGR